MLRFGIPVFDPLMQKRGIIVINYFGNIMLQHFNEESFQSYGTSMLLNSKGFWLRGEKPENEWGFMYEDAKNKKFENSYPDAWEKIKDDSNGQFENQEGLFTFTTVLPMAAAMRSAAIISGYKAPAGNIYAWIIVSRVSPDSIRAFAKRRLDRMLFYFAVIFIAAIGSWHLASTNLSRNRTRDELKAQRDHLQELVDARTAKIQQLNVELERKVEKRTGELNKALIDTEQARDRIDAIIKSVADGLIVTDINNNILFINPAAENMLGTKIEDAVNKPIEHAMHNKLFGEELKDLQSKKRIEFDFNLPQILNKQAIILRATTSVIQDRDNKRIGVVIIIRDVTHEREVDRMKTEFVSTAAHELRSPLTSIMGFSEILLTRKDLAEEEIRGFLKHINIQAGYLKAIIDDLLDISRIESGIGFSLMETFCVLETVIFETVHFFSAMSTKHSFTIHVPETSTYLYFDRDKIAQVLKNLLSNGGEIRITGESNDTYYQVCIEDQGIGMTPEQTARTFEKFYRADTTDSAIEGTGLGMTITKHIIEAHGGKIWVESEYGKGTSVCFRIPLKEAL
jgi:PAS domain S-box-containing protein